MVSAELFYNNTSWGLREAKAGKSIVAKESKDTQKAKAPPVKKTTIQSEPKTGEEFSR